MRYGFFREFFEDIRFFLGATVKYWLPLVVIVAVILLYLVLFTPTNFNYEVK